MILNILAVIHLLFSLIAIWAGAKVVFGLLAGKLLGKWTIAFLRCAPVASVTGLLFPSHPLLPAHWLAMLAVYASGAAYLAWCKFRLAGPWRAVYVLSIAIVFCLNIVFAARQAFALIPTLRVLTSTRSEPALLIAQLGILALVAVAGIAVAGRLCHGPTCTS